MPTGIYERKPQPVSDPIKRFWSKVDKSGNCWEWIGWRFSTGYGGFDLPWPKRKILAHRFSWEIHHGASS